MPLVEALRIYSVSWICGGMTIYKTLCILLCEGLQEEVLTWDFEELAIE